MRFAFPGNVMGKTPPPVPSPSRGPLFRVPALQEQVEKTTALGPEEAGNRGRRSNAQAAFRPFLAGRAASVAASQMALAVLATSSA